MTEVAGLIGLGIMGSAFARNLIAAGWDVVGYDVSQQACRSLVEAGGKIADSPAEIAAKTSRILLSLPSIQALNEVVTGSTGLMSARENPLIVADTSTLPLSAKESARISLLEAGHTMLDAPVSGTGAQAMNKDVVVFGSGPSEALEMMSPVFAGMSRRLVHAGSFGSGIQLKILANHLVTIHNVAAAETMAFAQKLGLNLETVYDVLCDSAGSSRMLQVRGPLMVRGTYTPPTATIYTHLKDLKIIEETAEAVSMPLPIYTSAALVYKAAEALGLGTQDTASVCAAIEIGVGIHREPKPKSIDGSGSL
jgi:putative dehydrogenase